MPSRSEMVAWAAGLFEGEGSISIQASTPNGRLRVRFTIGMTDEDVLRRFHEVVGCGNVNGPHHREGCKPIWRFNATKPVDVAVLAEMFTPYLGIRRLAALERCLAEYEAQPPKRNARRERTHCLHGHAYTDENTTRWANGTSPWSAPRRCLTCERNRRARRDVAKRMREIEAVRA